MPYKERKKNVVKKRIQRWLGNSCSHCDNYIFITSLKKSILIYKVENSSSVVCEITKHHPIVVPYKQSKEC